MELRDLWSTMRGIVRDSLSFAQIKDLIGSVGLPIHQLSHLQQKQGAGGASKGQLLDAIEELFSGLTSPEQDRIVASLVMEFLHRKPELEERLQELLSHVGWGISNGELHPLSLQIDLDTSKLPAAAAEGLRNCLRRYRDGDPSGAVTSVCGVVDTLTEEINNTQKLGKHKEATYQERISRAVATLEGDFKKSLSTTHLNAKDIEMLWQNLRQACNQAGYVLGTFRREFSDAHGVANAPAELVQRALDCSVFIVRTIVGGA